jgi:phosphopantothenoylcysteine decarboxylase/phosphopantothenate--cysteine ligase
MGYAIAEAARDLGADTILISGPTELTPPPGVKLVPVVSTADLHRAVIREFAKCDCLVMAAAPSDFTPEKESKRKIKRGDSLYRLELVPTPDILKAVSAKRKRGQIVVGFALETDHALANARKKLTDKKLDMIVVNQPGKDTGFGAATNKVTILRPGKKPISWPLAEKKEIAASLLDIIARMM